MNSIQEVSKEFLTASFARLRTNFLKGDTLSIAHRRFTLQTLKTVLKTREADLDEAVYKDLGLNSFYSYMTGTMNAITEINLALRKLDKWTSPIPRETPLTMFPSQIYETQEPLGTVLVIGAWNYPLATTLLPVISAIAAGNCVIAKPSEQAPNTSRVISEIMNSLDSNYYMGVEGGVQTSVTLNKLPFDLIVFTGGTTTGKFVMKDAADNLSRLVLELGGKNPTIIDHNANLDLAAKRIANMKFMNCGQTCVTADLVWVCKSVKTEFIKLFIKHVKLIHSVDAKNSPDYSLIINENHAKRILKFLEGQTDNIVYQFGVPDVKNRFIPPTIIVDPSRDSLLMKEEVFGPVFPILEFDNFKDVLNSIKAGDKPLGIYYFGDESSQNFIDLKNETSSGSLIANDLAINYLAFSGGFGGVGGSGVGKIRGFEGFQCCSNQKIVIERSRSSFMDLPMRYAPTSIANLKKMKFVGEYLSCYTFQDFTYYLKIILWAVLFFLLAYFLVNRGIVVINL